MVKNRTHFFNKKPIFIILFGLLITIVFFQVQKKNQYIKEKKEKIAAQKLANSEFVKLLDQRPVYQDSIYKIYISSFGEHTKIVFLRRDSISEVQKESEFFLHIYPQDTNLLINSKSKFLSYGFKNNVAKFTFNQAKYFVSSANLPDFVINKINTGQYGYKGNNEINWEITPLLTAESIDEILKINKEKNSNFQKRE